MSWLYKISQKYPGGDRDEYSNLFGLDWKRDSVHHLDVNEKFRAWGIDSDFRNQWHPFSDLGSDPNLSRIDPKNVNFAIDHLSEKYYSAIEPVLMTSIDFCQRRDQIYLDYNAEEMPEADTATNQLDEDVVQLATSLAERAEIRDDKFPYNLAEFIKHKVNLKMEDMLYERAADSICYVRVYGTSKAFGGAEEGGWWYDNTVMVQQDDIQGLQNACERKAALEREYENKGEDSFYDDLEAGHSGVRDLYDEESSAASGMGDLSYPGRDVEGMDFPPGWTTSSFDRFYVRVELTDKPQAEITERPRYE